MKTALSRSLTISAALFVFYAMRLQIRPESSSGARLVIVAAFAATGFLLSCGVIFAWRKTDWDWMKIFVLNIALTVLVAGVAAALNLTLPAWVRAL